MKFLSFKFIVILLIIILLFPVFIVSIFLVKNSVFPTWEGGNLSDWASILTNILLLILTFKISQKANNIFNNQRDQEAFKRGSDFLDAVDFIYDKSVLLPDRIENNIKSIAEANSNNNYNNISLDSVLKNTSKIMSEIYSLRLEVSGQIKKNDRLHRWGLQNNYKNQIKEHLTYTSKYLDLLYLICQHNYYDNFNIDTTDIYDYSKYTQEKTQLERRINDFIDSYSIFSNLELNKIFTINH
ncbi:hypothetical protein CI789_12070 [Erwinia persicina]|uniref:hypothetical protein n=1 Tax=Erwinia persicina TaxID=55211 RepID=UPI000E4F2A9B|nr:hypothetical protein [Erwinia persicina]AXU95905.1 hypothetical protein CI789_12070 [Erwinia persicina]